MKKVKNTMLQELQQLELRIKNGCNSPQNDPEEISLDNIEIIEAVFQHRDTVANESRRNAHVADLMKCLKDSSSKLDPVTVFWIGDAWCCIDGHHRLMAYRESGRTDTIPVEVFRGTLDEAVVKALEGNSKARLQMDSNERTNAAWRLVVGTNAYKSQIKRASNASDGTIGKMRRVKRALLERFPSTPLDSYDWRSAMRKAEGRDVIVNHDSPDWIELQAIDLANRITKKFGRELLRDPEITAKALEIYDSRLPESLSEYWKDGLEYETNDDF